MLTFMALKRLEIHLTCVNYFKKTYDNSMSLYGLYKVYKQSYLEIWQPRATKKCNFT